MNTIGKLFSVTSFGESHGRAVGCIVDGCSSNLAISEAEIQKELDKRKPGQELSTPRGEKDKVEILSGVFEGKTIGTPIMLMVENKDVDSSKYEALKDTPRPGHADLVYREKYKHVDWRGGSRASARETVARVASGAVAKKLLKDALGIKIIGYSRAIGNVISEGVLTDEKTIESNPVRALDKAKEMESAIKEAREAGDSLGGIVEVQALNVPPGLGEPVFDKLSADIAKALMSIPAVKGVEIGDGFSLAGLKGSEANDIFESKNGKVLTKTNRAGGIHGGISNGMPIVARIAMKPVASIGREQQTVDLKTYKAKKIKIEGRHDPCVVPRAVPIAESMLALVLADHGLISGKIPRVLG